MLSEEDINDLAGFFYMKGYEWLIDGESIIPTRQDLQGMIEACIETIREQGEGSISVESGGLLIKRTDDQIHVYCQVAEMKY